MQKIQTLMLTIMDMVATEGMEDTEDMEVVVAMEKIQTLMVSMATIMDMVATEMEDTEDVVAMEPLLMRLKPKIR